MHFNADHIYHVYNRGNNKTKIFFNDANYLFLLKKVRVEWLPYCNLLSYCLMPNHFHFILQPTERGCDNIIVKDGPSALQVLSKKIGHTLSSYTRAINNQNKTTGSLFQKKTKAKCLTDESICVDGLRISDYLENCFKYIHNNPLASLLVADLCNWQWSSWHEYYGTTGEKLCNIELAGRIFGLDFLRHHSLERNSLYQQAITRIW